MAEFFGYLTFALIFLLFFSVIHGVIDDTLTL